MTKRRLSKQQRGRINRAQQGRAELVTSDHDANVAVDAELGPALSGRVIACFGRQVLLTGDDGIERRCHLRANLGTLVAGDLVVWQADAGGGVVVATVPRQSVLQRPDARGQLRPMAANVDRIIVVFAPRPQPHQLLLDRYLVAAEQAGIEPLLLMNKSDALETLPPEEVSAIAALHELYAGAGYQIISSNSVSEQGLVHLRSALAGHISVLIGQSGVGKSSLINALLPAASQRTSALSGAQHGVHTTTSARWFALPGEGALIDSPGVREFNLVHCSADELAEGYKEFRARLGHCRFRNCRHQGDPGCALVRAVENGEISAQRLASFRLLLNEVGQTP